MTDTKLYAITGLILLAITVGWHWLAGDPMIELPLRIAFVTAGVLLVRWIWWGTRRF